MAREQTPKVPAEEVGDETETKEPTIKDVMDTINNLANRVDGLGRFTTALKGEIEGVKKPKEKNEQAEQESQSLTARTKRLEEDREKVRAKNIKMAIAGALQAEGITDADRAKEQADFLKHKFSGRLSVDEADDTVTIDDGGEKVAVGKYLHAYLQTPEGNWLLPMKNPPRDGKAAKGTGHTLPSTTTEDGRLIMTRSQYSKGNFSKAVADKVRSGDFTLVPDDV